MICSTQDMWDQIRMRLVFFFAAAVALTLTPALVSAQRITSQSTAAPRSPVAIGGGIHRPPVSAAPPPARAALPTSVTRAGVAARPGWAAYPVRLRNAPRMRGVGIPARVSLPEGNLLRVASGSPRFIAPFFLSAPFPQNLGIAGSVGPFGGMPLGFGLWPACDSARMPGVFWTVGPCFGLGSYFAELAPIAAPPTPYLAPLVLFSQPPSGPGAAQAPSATGPPATMTLYLTDGQSIAAKDWWVAQGRLQYITDSGQTGAVDVLRLDLERTIKENQKRGLDFRLKFTAPSDLYPPSIRP